MKRTLTAGIAVLALGIALAWGANNFRQSTSGGTVTTFKSTDNAGVHTPHVNVDTLTGGAVTADTELPAAAAAADAMATPTAPFVESANFLFNGTTWDRRRSAVGTTGIAAVNTEGVKATYSTAGNAALVASATDVCTLVGSASKTIRVTRVSWGGVATAATSVPVQLRRYSTAASGGTSSAFSFNPHDSTNAAATATGVLYTANPTVGGSAAVLRQAMTTFTTAASSPVAALEYSFDFTTRNTQGIVLRGTGQYVSVNLLGQTVTGGNINCSFEHTEE
jgi:hypothetical protein